MGRLITWMLSKWASFRFWLASKRLVPNKHYVIQRGENDRVHIEMLRGKYRGVKFTFDNIQLNENEPLIEFITIVKENPNWVDISSKRFDRLCSNIFRALLREVLHETGTSYTFEFDEEREFYEESSPLLEKRILRRKSR